MGVYIYTLRAKNINIDIDGETIKANLLKFAFKPYASLYPDEQPKVFKMMLGRAESYWSKNETSEYFVVGDDFETGNMVYKGWRKGKAWAYDEPDFPGKPIGFLKKIGKKFIITKSAHKDKDEGSEVLMDGEWVKMCHIYFV